MKFLRGVLCLAFAIFPLAALSFAAEGDGADDGGEIVSVGERLFNDQGLGTNGQSCASCHLEGRGLSEAGSRTEWKLGSKTFPTLAEVVNFCITGPLEGTALDVDSAEMKALEAYIESLGSDGAETGAPDRQDESEAAGEEEGFGC